MAQLMSDPVDPSAILEDYKASFSVTPSPYMVRLQEGCDI